MYISFIILLRLDPISRACFIQNSPYSTRRLPSPIQPFSAKHWPKTVSCLFPSLYHLVLIVYCSTESYNVISTDVSLAQFSLSVQNSGLNQRHFHVLSRPTFIAFPFLWNDAFTPSLCDIYYKTIPIRVYCTCFNNNVQIM